MPGTFPYTRDEIEEKIIREERRMNVKEALEKGEVVVRKTYEEPKPIEDGFGYVQRCLEDLYQFYQDNGVTDIFYKDIVFTVNTRLED